MLKLLVNAGANTNLAERQTGRTPLHRAALSNWFEGVDTLISAGDTEVLLDAQGHSAYDYARVPEIAELIRDYIEDRHVVVDDSHPVVFDFGIVFDEGRWVVATSGPNIGDRVLQAPAVPRDVRQQRIVHQLVDRDSIVRKLKRAGLFVQVETVLAQEKALGLIATGVRHYLLVRVGAPVYRLQLEAERMRFRAKRTGADAAEFFVDHATFPDTGFQPFTRGERQQILLNIIEAPMVDSPLTSLRATPRPPATVTAGAAGKVEGRAATVADVRSAGIKMALYVRLRVVRKFMVLHDDVGREEVLDAWNLGHQRKRGYWRRQMRSFVDRRAMLRPLQAVFKYFGSKLGFYEAFVHHAGHAMLVPATAGAVCFGILWVPLRPPSEVTGKTSVTLSYDHPIAYFFFLVCVIWAAVLVRGWATKEAELRFRWRLDTVHEYPKTPNPASTAVVRRLYVNNAWQYVPVTTPAMLKARVQWICASVAAWLLAAAAALFSAWAIVVVVIGLIDNDPKLHHNFNNPLTRTRNYYGTAALYATTAANALAIFTLNALWERVAVWLTYRENFGTVYEHDTSLAIKLVTFQYLNSTASLYYFAYYKRDFDLTAATLAAIVVVGQVLALLIEYALPWLGARGKRVARADVERIAAKGTPEADKAGADAEGGPGALAEAGGGMGMGMGMGMGNDEDLAETGECGK